MLISRITTRSLSPTGQLACQPTLSISIAKYKRKPARCHLTTVSGLTIACASRTPGRKPSKANKNQAVDGAEGLFLRTVQPQNFYLLPQHPNFHLERCPRRKTDLRRSKQ